MCASHLHQHTANGVGDPQKETSESVTCLSMCQGKCRSWLQKIAETTPHDVWTSCCLDNGEGGVQAWASEVYNQLPPPPLLRKHRLV